VLATLDVPPQAMTPRQATVFDAILRQQVSIVDTI
jgi:hypothetical protein